MDWNYVGICIERKPNSNQKLIDKARSLAGIKADVTNLDILGEEVVAYFHQLFHSEASFRMAKFDLEAQPICHRKLDSIQALLTIVVSALAISGDIKHQTGISLKKFVRLIRALRSAIETINSKEVLADPELSPEVSLLLNNLTSGHQDDKLR